MGVIDLKGLEGSSLVAPEVVRAGGAGVSVPAKQHFLISWTAWFLVPTLTPTFLAQSNSVESGQWGGSLG